MHADLSDNKPPGGVVWSPFSNLWLYDQTTDVVAARAHGVMVCIGSDWGPSGSKNLLGELKVARIVIDVFHPDLAVSDRDLVDMVTRHPARILRWENQLGSLADGARAHLLVVNGTKGDDYFKDFHS